MKKGLLLIFTLLIGLSMAPNMMAFKWENCTKAFADIKKKAKTGLDSSKTYLKALPEKAKETVTNYRDNYKNQMKNNAIQTATCTAVALAALGTACYYSPSLLGFIKDSGIYVCSNAIQLGYNVTTNALILAGNTVKNIGSAVYNTVSETNVSDISMPTYSQTKDIAKTVVAFGVAGTIGYSLCKKQTIHRN